MTLLVTLSRFFILIASIVMLATACGPRDGAGGGAKLSVEDLRFEAELAKARLDTAWAAMIRSDDRRIENIDYLLNTVMYQTNPDTMGIGLLRADNRRSRQIRYNRESLNNPASIDLYDVHRYRIDSLIGQVYQRNPGMAENYNSRMIISEIQAAQDSIILYRVYFDQQADSYNQIIRRYERSLRRLGPPYDQMNRQGMFRLES